MAHQPAISFSISFQHPFNRAGGRTSNVAQEMLRICLASLLVGVLAAVADQEARIGDRLSFTLPDGYSRWASLAPQANCCSTRSEQLKAIAVRMA